MSNKPFIYSVSATYHSETIHIDLSLGHHASQQGALSELTEQAAIFKADPNYIMQKETPTSVLFTKKTSTGSINFSYWVHLYITNSPLLP